MFENSSLKYGKKQYLEQKIGIFTVFYLMIVKMNPLLWMISPAKIVFYTSIFSALNQNKKHSSTDYAFHFGYA